MATKKVPSMDAITKQFQDILNRCQFNEIKRINRTLYCVNKKNKNSFISIEQSLWNEMLDKKILDNVVELNPSLKDERIIINTINLLNDEGWICIDDNAMMNDDRIRLGVNGLEYNLEINKTIWPLRFKKAECNNFSYKIILDPLTFIIKKRFEGPEGLTDSSWDLMRIFQIL